MRIKLNLKRPLFQIAQVETYATNQRGKRGERVSTGTVLEPPSNEHLRKTTYDPQDDKRPSPSMGWASLGDISPKL